MCVLNDGMGSVLFFSGGNFLVHFMRYMREPGICLSALLTFGIKGHSGVRRDQGDVLTFPILRTLHEPRRRAGKHCVCMFCLTFG